MANPYELSNIINSLNQAKRMSGNIQTADKFATRKFMGQETEVAEDMMRDKSKLIDDILGSQSKEEKNIGGLLQGLSAGASFMNPLAGALTSGITSLLGSGYKRRKQEKRIAKAREAAKMPSKYAKSWLGKTTKDFTGKYETELDKMKKSLASDSDIFKSALMSGVGTYLLSGGADEMKALKGAEGGMGMFSGGLDLWGGGLKTSKGVADILGGTAAPGFDITNIVSGINKSNLGTPLFGEGNLLQNFFKGGAGSKEAAQRLSPLLQFLNY